MLPEPQKDVVRASIRACDQSLNICSQSLKKIWHVGASLMSSGPWKYMVRCLLHYGICGQSLEKMWPDRAWNNIFGHSLKWVRSKPQADVVIALMIRHGQSLKPLRSETHTHVCGRSSPKKMWSEPWKDVVINFKKMWSQPQRDVLGGLKICGQSLRKMRSEPN